MPRYYSPYPTVTDLRRSGAYLAAPSLDSRWRPILEDLRVRLGRLPAVGVPIRIQAANGLSEALVPLHTSEGELRQALAACSPAAGGFTVGSAAQVQCWFGAIGSQVGEMRTALDRIRGLIAAHERALLPKGTNGLRSTQLAFIESQKRFAGALSKITGAGPTGWASILERLGSTVRSFQALENDLNALAPTMSGEPEFDALRRSAVEGNLELLRKVMLPLVDISLAELKTVRRAEQIAQESLGRQAELAQFVPEYRRTLEDFIDHLRSHNSDGLLGAIVEGLFGKEPTKTVVKFILGLGLAAVVISGSVVLVRRSIRSRS